MQTFSFDNSMLAQLATIAKDAGKVTMQYFNKSNEVITKKDGSPVTIADKETEQYIIAELLKLDPSVPCVGEEGDNSKTRVSELERYWCVDPLDGTQEFIHNRPEFTVNIALVENGKPLMGVIYAPALNMLYVGDRKLGSYRVNSDNSSQRLPLKSESDVLTLAISRSHPTAGQEQEFMNKLERQTQVITKSMGSSLKFCMVAEGTADLYFRAGRTMFWDTAAGHVIATAAGANAINWATRQELMYVNDSMENPAFLVYNNKASSFIY